MHNTSILNFISKDSSLRGIATDLRVYSGLPGRRRWCSGKACCSNVSATLPRLDHLSAAVSLGKYKSGLLSIFSSTVLISMAAWSEGPLPKVARASSWFCLVISWNCSKYPATVASPPAAILCWMKAILRRTTSTFRSWLAAILITGNCNRSGRGSWCWWFMTRAFRVMHCNSFAPNSNTVGGSVEVVLVLLQVQAAIWLVHTGWHFGAGGKRGSKVDTHKRTIPPFFWKKQTSLAEVYSVAVLNGHVPCSWTQSIATFLETKRVAEEDTVADTLSPSHIKSHSQQDGVHHC